MAESWRLWLQGLSVRRGEIIIRVFFPLLHIRFWRYVLWRLQFETMTTVFGVVLACVLPCFAKPGAFLNASFSPVWYKLSHGKLFNSKKVKLFSLYLGVRIPQCHTDRITLERFETSTATWNILDMAWRQTFPGSAQNVVALARRFTHGISYFTNCEGLTSHLSVTCNGRIYLQLCIQYWWNFLAPSQHRWYSAADAEQCKLCITTGVWDTRRPEWESLACSSVYEFLFPFGHLFRHANVIHAVPPVREGVMGTTWGRLGVK